MKIKDEDDAARDREREGDYYVGSDRDCADPCRLRKRGRGAGLAWPVQSFVKRCALIVKNR